MIAIVLAILSAFILVGVALIFGGYMYAREQDGKELLSDRLWEYGEVLYHERHRKE